MSTLNFPVNPINGQLYPSTPLVGEKVYKWDSAYRTWTLLGTATGVDPGTYGNGLFVGRFTVDQVGRITYAENIPIQLGTTAQVGLVQLTDDTTSDDPTTALTAAQGFYLQNQIGNIDLLVPPAVDLVTAINVAYSKTADVIPLNPPINGNITIQTALEDAVYGIASPDSTVTITSVPTGYYRIEVTQATETQLGGAEVATQEEVNDGIGDTKFITPQKLEAYVVGGQIDATNIALSPEINGNQTVQSALKNAVYDIASPDNTVIVASDPTGLFTVDVTQATEIQLGGAAIATQAEVSSGADDTRFVTPLKLATYVDSGGIMASQIPVNPPVSENDNVQAALEDAVYSVVSSESTITVTEDNPGQIDIDLPDVGAIGSYTYASVTVDAQGRVIDANSNTAPNTEVVSPLINLGTAVEPVIDVLPASTSQAGVVQLNNTLTSTAVDQALTAAQGKSLQDQLYALSISGGLINAGMFNAATGQMVSVTPGGSSVGFTVGANIPSPTSTITDYIVQISTGGTYTPPGGSTPLDLVVGDWLLCTGTTWVQITVGPRLPDASTSAKGIVQLATDAETQAGTNGSKAVTPSSLDSRTATETRTGLSEIATQEQVDDGADDARYVTPLKLFTYLSNGGGEIPASGVIVSPPINSRGNVQAALENAIYSISSTKLTITEEETGEVTIEAPKQLYHYTQLNDISGGFDGVKTTFTLQVGGSTYTPTPPGNLMVFLGGVIQIPGAGNAYTISTNTITFSEPPPIGTSFYATTITNN